MNFDNFLNGMFGKVQNGMCRISANGGIAIKTSNGYKTYNVKTGRLTNCSNFVFNIGEEFFFVIPTNKVAVGDIILAAGKPKCVISVDKNTIKVINYEDSTVEDILPERHVFMGNTYFYGKIVSMFGQDFNKDGKKGMNKIMRYALLSEMMGGSKGSSSGMFSGNSMLPFMLMSGGGSDMFGDVLGDILNFDDLDFSGDDEEETPTETAEVKGE